MFINFVLNFFIANYFFQMNFAVLCVEEVCIDQLENRILKLDSFRITMKQGCESFNSIF